MLRAAIIISSAVLLLLSCGKNAEPATSAEPVDTIPMMISQLRKCSRLYTSEYRIHKIITHEDQVKLSGTVLQKDFNIDLPIGERRIAIPMEATVKAYVDFSKFSKDNVERRGDKLTVYLPDPQIVLTSTRINHKEIRRQVALMRRNFSDKELADYEQQGRKAIVEATKQMDIDENVRQHAANTIIPMIVAMGFRQEDITVTFRKPGNSAITTILK